MAEWTKKYGEPMKAPLLYEEGFCGLCGAKLKTKTRKFCSHNCRVDFQKIYGGGSSRGGNGVGKHSNPPWLRVHVLTRDGYKCKKCGCEPKKYYYAENCGVIEVVDIQKLTVHHEKPISEGGDDDPSNLTTLCIDCHRAEHTKERSR